MRSEMSSITTDVAFSQILVLKQAPFVAARTWIPKVVCRARRCDSAHGIHEQVGALWLPLTPQTRALEAGFIRRDADWEEWDWTLGQLERSVEAAVANGTTRKSDPEPLTAWYSLVQFGFVHDPTVWMLLRDLRWHHHFRMLPSALYAKLTRLQSSIWLEEAQQAKTKANISMTHAVSLLPPIRSSQ